MGRTKSKRKQMYYKGRDWSKGTKEKNSFKRAYLLLLFPMALGITLLCKYNPWVAEEVFAKRIYRSLSIGIGFITSWIPFSMAELIVVLGPLLILWFLLRFLFRVIVEREKRHTRIGNFLLNIASTVSVLLLTFTLLCGVNYYRYPFSHYSGLEVVDSSIDELEQLCLELAQKANFLRSQIPQVDENGVFELTTGKKETAKKARDAMEQLSKEYPVLAGWDVIPKPVMLSRMMSYTEITGIFFPFTMEANVNTDISDYSIPATMCHELGHVRGFMREDEANFLAYLACMSSEDVEFQYSGTMLALIHSGNALYRQNKELYQKVKETYSEGVVQDLVANSVYWNRFEDTVVSKVANHMNDTYLKANNQTDGVYSYGRMVDLLLALHRRQTENVN